MKKFLVLTTTLKAFAAMLFAGFICLYIVGGIIYASFVDDTFGYTISFVHLLLSIGFSVIISLLWGICFGHMIIKKWRFLFRYLLFDLLLVALLALCIFSSSFISTQWNTLWLIIAVIMVAFVMVLSVISEWYFKKTGKQYTELLKIYQANLNKHE